MDQKEIVEKIFAKGTMNLSRVIDVLEKLSNISFTELLNALQPLEGEVDFHKFWSRTNPSERASMLLNSKVDLEQFKKVFESYNITCAYNPTTEGTELYFKAKDQKVVEMASREILEKIIRKPKRATVLLKKPNQMTFYERVHYTKQKTFKTARKIPLSQKTIKK